MSDQASVAEPTLPDAQMHLVRPKEPVAGRFVSTASCMKGKSPSFVRHVEIDVSGTPLAGNFKVGQSFGVIAPGEDENGKPHQVRLYSIASPSWGEDGDGNVLSTTVKRLIDERTPQKDSDDPDDHSLFVGVCSNYLCDINPGAEVLVSGPNGKRFLLPESPGDYDYLFVATGTGIAPFRGMMMELLEAPGGPVSGQIHLVMGAPYTGDLLYDDLFARLAEEHDNAHYHPVISREKRPDGRRGQYVHHYIDERMDLFQPLLAGPRTIVYMCGLLGMQFGLYQAFVRHGVADGYITIKDELKDVPLEDWDTTAMRRYVKATGRCMIEVY